MTNQVFDALVNSVQHAAGDPDFARHVKGFVRTNRGSHIVGLDDLHTTLEFLHNVSARCVEVSHDEVNSECPGAARAPARYFKFDIPDDHEAYEAVCLLEDLSGSELERVRVRQGDLGFELVMPDLRLPHAQNSDCRVDTGWIILGPTEGVKGDVVYTWYPGRMTAGSPLDKHAVKIIS